MKRRVLPRIDFKKYRKPRYLLACHSEWGRGAVVYAAGYKRESCPLCQGANAEGRVFSWSFEKCAFYCHRCKATGDALQMVRLMLRCNVIEAAKWLEEKAGPAGSGLVLPVASAQ